MTTEPKHTPCPPDNACRAQTMDTEKLKMGWALFIVSGLYARENAKVKRWLKREGFVKLATNTYARSCVIGYEGLEKLVQKWEALNTVETKVQAIYLTRHQWDHSHVRMGPSDFAGSGVHCHPPVKRKPKMNNLHLMTRTEKGIGGYTDSVSYKLANGDLSREEAAVILQTLADNERLREALQMALVQIKQDNDERKVEHRGTEWQIRAALSATEKPCNP